jgi:hypothetical protein
VTAASELRIQLRIKSMRGPGSPLIQGSDTACQPFAHGALAPVLLKGAAASLSASCALAFILPTSLGVTVPPPHTLSQYAAEWPAAYFFRSGTTFAAVLLAQAGLLLRHRGARWPVLLVPAGVSLGACASVSCKDNKTMHTTFAFLAFILLGATQMCAARALRQAIPALAWAQELGTSGHRSVDPLFRLPRGSDIAKRGGRLAAAWGAGAWLVCASVLLALLIASDVAGGALGSGGGASSPPLGGRVVAVLEWLGVANFVWFLIELARVVGVEEDGGAGGGGGGSGGRMSNSGAGSTPKRTASMPMPQRRPSNTRRPHGSRDRERPFSSSDKAGYGGGGGGGAASGGAAGHRRHSSAGSGSAGSGSRSAGTGSGGAGGSSSSGQQQRRTTWWSGSGGGSALETASESAAQPRAFPGRSSLSALDDGGGGGAPLSILRANSFSEGRKRVQWDRSNFTPGAWARRERLLLHADDAPPEMHNRELGDAGGRMRRADSWSAQTEHGRRGGAAGAARAARDAGTGGGLDAVRERSREDFSSLESGTTDRSASLDLNSSVEEGPGGNESSGRGLQRTPSGGLERTLSISSTASNDSMTFV